MVVHDLDLRWALRRPNKAYPELVVDPDRVLPLAIARYADAVYVLHAFQKKSNKGIATPKAEIDLIEKRLKDLIKEKEARQ